MNRGAYVTTLIREIALMNHIPGSDLTIKRLNELAELINYPHIFRQSHPLFNAHLTIKFNKHIDCCKFNSLLSAYLSKHKAYIIGRIIPTRDGCFHTMEIIEIDLLADAGDQLALALFI